MAELHRRAPECALGRTEYAHWLFICICTVLVNSTFETMLVPALPEIRAELNLTTGESAWIFTALTLSAAVTMPIVGRLADVYGKRRVFVCVVALITAGILSVVLAPSFAMLVVGQALQGIGMSLIPLSVAILGDLTEDKTTVNTAGLMMAVAASSTFGSLLAGVVLASFSYHVLYWAAVIPDLLIIALAALAARREPVVAQDGEDQRIDWFGAFLLGGGLLALLAGVTLIGAAEPDVRLGKLFALSVAMLVAWAWRSLKIAQPLVDIRPLRSAAINRTAVIQLATGFGTFATFVLVPMIVVAPSASGGLGLSASAAGYCLFPFGLASVGAPALVGWMRKLLGVGGVMLTGSVFAIAGPLVLAAAHDIVLVGAATAALGLGIGVIVTQTFDLLGSAVPAGRLASLSSLIYVLKMVGAAIGGQASVGFVGPDPAASGFVLALSVATTAMAIAMIAAFTLKVTVRAATAA